jgi:Bacterial RNA polymerase, alpha chain C terminal domain
MNLSQRVNDLPLPFRVRHALVNYLGIQTLDQLVVVKPKVLLKTKDIGAKSLRDIKQLLQEMGLSLGMDPGEWGRIVCPTCNGEGRIVEFRERCESLKCYVAMMLESVGEG